MTSANHITQTPHGAVVMIRSIEDQNTTVAVDLSYLTEHGKEPENIRAAAVKDAIPDHRLTVGDTVLIDTADTTLKAGEIYAVQVGERLTVGRIWRESRKVEIIGRVWQLMLGDV